MKGEDALDDILREADHKMAAAVEHTRGEFAKIRTGRANPQLVADLPVDYYGTQTPLQQLAGISVPEPRLLVVSPYDRNALKEIERAISSADLGLNPANDGTVIRVVFPELTEERRREFVRLARERAEEGRVAIRNVRRHAKTDLARMESDGEIPEDDHHRADKALQELTGQNFEAYADVWAKWWAANKEKFQSQQEVKVGAQILESLGLRERGLRLDDLSLLPEGKAWLLLEFGTLGKLTGKSIYYDRAKRALVERFAGEVPNTLEALTQTFIESAQARRGIKPRGRKSCRARKQNGGSARRLARQLPCRRWVRHRCD